MKCTLCTQRKGKRSCPARDSLICVQCCGEKRMIEIGCPESCPYLQRGRRRELDQTYSRHLDSLEPEQRKKAVRVLSEHETVVSLLELLVAEERRTTRDLSDAALAEALDLLLATLQTEDKGVLYERTSNNPHVDHLRRRLQETVHSCRYPKQPSQQRLPLSHAVECLELLSGLVEGHRKGGYPSKSYVEFLARNMPRMPNSAAAGSRIIIPGR